MQKQNKSRKLTVRLSDKEYQALSSKFKESTCSQLSQYARTVLLGKPVTVRYRNESLDGFMEEIILLRQELNAIGNNFNQEVRKLHSLRQIPEFRHWLMKNEEIHLRLINKTDSINQLISTMSEKWWQE